MKISIIGCGWLGLPLGTFLAKKGYEVKGSTTSEAKLEMIKNAGMQPFLIDLKLMINNKELAEAKEAFFKTDILYINIPPSRRIENIETIYPKWISFLIKQCEQFGIKQVIFVSSTGVYPNTESIVTEATATAPKTNGQKGIVAAEQLLLNNKNFTTTILRPAGLIGGSRNPAKWFAGRKNATGGNVPVNFVHLDDCIGISHAVLEQKAFGEIFNMCADEHPTKAEFYPALAKKYGYEPPTFQMEKATDFKIVSNEKVKRVTGYEFRVLTNWSNLL